MVQNIRIEKAFEALFDLENVREILERLYPRVLMRFNK